MGLAPPKQETKTSRYVDRYTATAGVLTYIEASDSIVLRAAEEPEGEAMAE